ncbi:ATP-grasp domain-containing protein [Streptomyces lavenduligriseus]|uniref:ATP-grasp domain-containing protein n=1 Tax=Streptomyces lavenduligriseus TaxID=67315 RepID=A0ABT0P0F1_9ACTN|nr:ATP-grasp domain-containing protein [Streptomyces lavenduligriseus]MCL3997199.1 ATP-grasp domain-containing protein [Streptomyces lavenduligriseus]
MPATPLVCVVDSYGLSKKLVDEFLRRGAAVVRVQSTPDVPAAYRGPFDLSDYHDNIVHRGDLAATARAVAAHRPVAVVPGGEIGVELADALSELLGLPTNGTSLSAARRNKYLMIETVRQAGLAAARQAFVTDERAVRAWHASVGGRIVVKPLRSAAGNGVHFCDTPEESAAAARAVIGSRNVFSERNTAAVAQEYLRGTEYMVNTVSRDRVHRVCEIWRTTRITANGVADLSDTVYLMPRRGEVQDRLTAYAGEVLDALGIRHGPAHIEIKITASGPVLVEAGARIGGANLPHYAQLARGASQLDWTVDAYLEPDRFMARHKEDDPRSLHCAFVGLVSPFCGTLRGYPYLERLRALESFHELRLAVSPGQRIRRTVDDLSYPAIVVLLHDSEETVLRDANTIRYLDGPSFYDVADPGRE